MKKNPLDDLMDILNPIVQEVNETDNASLLILGTLLCNEEAVSVSTCTIAAGFLGIIAEGLYAELADQIQKNQKELFHTIRRVIHDLEKDFDLQEECDDESDEHISTSFH
jgi:uncharacterized protein involved in cysteine biosynthesis